MSYHVIFDLSLIDLADNLISKCKKRMAGWVSDEGESF